MTDIITLGQDAAWYVDNLDKISGFKNYLKIVETDILPNRIGNLLVCAAREAVSELDPASDLIIESDDHSAWWFVEGAYDANSEIGAYVYVGVPEGNIDWLAGDKGKDWPCLSVYTYGGDGPIGKAKSKKFAKIITSGMKVPLKRLRMHDEFDDGYYCVGSRDLSDIITLPDLQHPAELLKELTKQIRDFTLVVMPGLNALKNQMRRTN